MFTVSESSDAPALTLGDLRKATRKLPDNTILIFQNGDYRQSTGEKVTLMRHIAAGDERMFVPRGHKPESGVCVPLLELKSPVVVIDYNEPRSE